MIKDILTVVGRGERDPAGDYAISVAAEFQAHTLAVAPAYDFFVPGTIFGTVATDIVDLQRVEAEKLADQAVTRFEKAAKAAGISSETIKMSETTAVLAQRVAAMARCFDLAVVEQPDPDSSSVADQVTVETLLFDSGRPVLMVPYIQKDPLKLDHVMVCWDGSRTSARAVADAMPFLERAKAASIVMVSGEPGKNMLPGADLAKHLARHQIKVEVETVPAGISVGNALLSRAADFGTDLIVMGGYGHSQIREFVLGGVTRLMLESMTAPVLMSH